MEDQEIKKLVDSKVADLEKLVDKKVKTAIDDRIKRVSLKIKLFCGAITAILSFMVFIGFTKDEMAAKVREAILPKTHIIAKLTTNDDESKKLKKHIISELNDPSFKEYPEVKSSIETNVWETIGTEDKEKIDRFLKNSILDEEIINSYYNQINTLLFNPEPCDKTKRNLKILEIGKIPQPVKIGHFENNNNAKTNCDLPFFQDRKRAIIYFPVSSRKNDGSNSLPWFKCPSDIPGVVISLKIEDIEVGGVRVVGVERPTQDDNIQGIRARVSKAVADAFENRGISLGQHVTSGTMQITDIWE